LITAFLWTCTAYLPLVVAFAVAASTGSPNDSNLAFFISVLTTVVAYALLARRVSYRWFDCFIMLIPVANALWSIKIMWRVSNLPHRSWTPRPEETTARVA
jgi:hypothetical protein